MDTINEILMQLANDNINRYDQVDSKQLNQLYEKLDGLLYIVIKNGKIDSYKHEKCHWSDVTRIDGYINLLNETFKMFPNQNYNFELIINISDKPHNLPIFNFCRFPGQKTFLFPNFRFGYDDIILEKTFNTEKKWSNTRHYLMNYPKEYNQKLSKFYMSGIAHIKKKDYFLYALNNLDLCDFYIVNCVHNDVNFKPETQLFKNILDLNKTSINEWEQRDYKENLDYKYLIYTDGNTLSDRMRLYLNSKSITFMYKPEYEEFYSPLISNMNNYIIFDNYNKLIELKEIVEKDEKLVNNILNNNKMFNELFLKDESIYTYIHYSIENYAKIFH
jgi:hypothetical protein